MLKVPLSVVVILKHRDWEDYLNPSYNHQPKSMVRLEINPNTEKVKMNRLLTGIIMNSSNAS